MNNCFPGTLNNTPNTYNSVNQFGTPWNCTTGTYGGFIPTFGGSFAPSFNNLSNGYVPFVSGFANMFNPTMYSCGTPWTNTFGATNWTPSFGWPTNSLTGNGCFNTSNFTPAYGPGYSPSFYPTNTINTFGQPGNYGWNGSCTTSFGSPIGWTNSYGQFAQPYGTFSNYSGTPNYMNAFAPSFNTPWTPSYGYPNNNAFNGYVPGNTIGYVPSYFGQAPVQNGCLPFNAVPGYTGMSSTPSNTNGSYNYTNGYGNGQTNVPFVNAQNGVPAGVNGPVNAYGLHRDAA
ncbi:MAG: hypothetical protein JNM07_00440 [Phycisphaerae bacterium]|nr:hypothetical protein [Phycisphaerae bacterium]